MIVGGGAAEGEPTIRYSGGGAAEAEPPIRYPSPPANSLEGWDPQPESAAALREIVEHAFDYRGNTTVVKTDGTELEGYVFNRNADVSEPFIQMFDLAGAGPLTIPYAAIRTIRFTGKDTAAGNSYAAWLKRKEQKAEGQP
jgi:hypothetical protein